MDDNKKKLYDALSNDYDLGSFEQFSADVQDEGKRRSLYDAIIDDYDLPDFETFSSDLIGSTAQPVAQAPASAAQTAPAQRKMPAAQNYQQANGGALYTPSVPLPAAKDSSANRGTIKPKAAAPKGARPMAQSNPVANNYGILPSVQQEQPVPFADAANTDRVRNVEQMRKENPIAFELEDAYAERERLTKIVNQMTAEANEAMSSPTGLYSGKKYPKEGELAMYKVALHKNDARIKALEREKKNYGFFKSLMQTGNAWTFGTQDLYDASILAKHAGKDEGDAYNAMMRETVKDQEADKYRANDRFIQRAADITGNSLPFVVEFVLTGGMGDAVTAGAKASSKAAAKIVGDNMASKAGRFVVKAIGCSADDFVKGAIMANTTGSARTAAKVLDIKSGDVVQNADGTYSMRGGESLGKSLYRGEMSSIIEYWSEFTGNHMGTVLGMGKSFVGGTAVGKKVASWAAKAQSKIGASKVGRMYANALESDFVTDARVIVDGVNQGMKKFQIQELPYEALEEYDGFFKNIIFNTGENKFEELGDPKMHADIWFGMCISMGCTKAPAFGFTTAAYYMGKHDLDKMDVKASTVIGEDKWNEMRDVIDGTKNEDMAGVIANIAMDGSLSNEQKGAALDYMQQLGVMRGFNMRMNAKAKSRINKGADSAEDVMSDEDSAEYARGYNANDQDAYDIITKALATGNKDAAYYGVAAQMRDKADMNVARRKAEAERMAADDGNLHPVEIMDTDNPNGEPKTVFWKSGNIVMSEDGKSVNAAESDKTIALFDPTTGEVSMYSPSDIIGVNPLTSVDELVAGFEEQEKSILEQNWGLMNGEINVSVGEQFTMPNGVSGVVSAVNGDEVTVVLQDGSSDVVSIAAMKEEQMQARIADYQKRNGAFDDNEDGDVIESGVPSEYVNGMVVRMVDSDGAEKEATIMGRGRMENGEFVEDENGKVIEYAIDGRVEHKRIDKMNEAVVGYEAQEKERVDTIEPVDAIEEQQQPSEPIAQEQVPVEEAPVVPVEEIAPVTPDEAYRGLVADEELTAEDVTAYIDNNLAEAQKMLAEAEKDKPVMGTDLAAFKAAKAEWQSGVDAAQADVEHWSAVKALDDAAHADAQAEAERVKAEEEARAKAEAERKAAEEAARVEAEKAAKAAAEENLKGAEESEVVKFDSETKKWIGIPAWVEIGRGIEQNGVISHDVTNFKQQTDAAKKGIDEMEKSSKVGNNLSLVRLVHDTNIGDDKVVVDIDKTGVKNHTAVINAVQKEGYDVEANNHFSLGYYANAKFDTFDDAMKFVEHVRELETATKMQSKGVKSANRKNVLDLANEYGLTVNMTKKGAKELVDSIGEKGIETLLRRVDEAKGVLEKYGISIGDKHPLNADSHVVSAGIDKDGKEYIKLVDELGDKRSESQFFYVDADKWEGFKAENRKDEEGGDKIVPIGVGPFGNIFNQFKGKAKEAIYFLLGREEGKAVSALYHPEVGYIDLWYGNDKAGLKKIANKHPEVLEDLQGILEGMNIVQQSENRIVLESDTHKAIVSKKLGDMDTDEWLLTAYEKKENGSSDGSSDIDSEPGGLQNGTAPLQTPLSDSDGKGTNNSSNNEKKNEEKSEVVENEVEKSSNNNGGKKKKSPKIVEKIDVEGLFGALKKNGEAKLSDHVVDEDEAASTEESESALTFAEGDEYTNGKGMTAKVIFADNSKGTYVRISVEDKVDGQSRPGRFEKNGTFERVNKWLHENGMTKQEQKAETKRLVSDDRMEELKNNLRKKLNGQLNVGVDPELLAIGAELAVGHIERGLTKFADYAKQMVDDIGEAIRPYLKSFYNAVRDMPEAQEYANDMDSYDDVRVIDVNNIGAVDTAEPVVETPVEATSEAYTIIPTQYTTAKGKVIDMQLVTFGRELSKEEIAEGKAIAKDAKGWWSSKDGGFLMRDEESAKSLAGQIVNNEVADNEVVENGENGIKVEGAENNVKSDEESAISEKKDVSLQNENAEKKVFDEEGANKFTSRVAYKLINSLSVGEEKPFKSIVDLRKLAKECGLDVDDEGRDDVRLNELVEDALISCAIMIYNDAKGDVFNIETYEKVCKLYAMQPSINARSSNRIALQQYSTPLPMGLVADMFAHGNREGIVGFEPTAGNGMLVSFFPNSIVDVNEIDETRLINLRKGYYRTVTERDATKEFGRRKYYDFIVSNPPFGHTEAKDYDGYNISGLEHQIAINALNQMKDDGKAAIIIGGNMEYASNGSVKGQKAFWAYLYDHYNVKGVIDMSGDLYKKQGTTYPTRMILIDGRRSDEERAQVRVFPPVKEKAYRPANTFEDLWDIANEIINDNRKHNGNEILRSGAGQPVSDSERQAREGNERARGEKSPKNDGTANGAGRERDSRGERNVADGGGVLRGESRQDVGVGTDKRGVGGSESEIRGNDTRGLGERTESDSVRRVADGGVRSDGERLEKPRTAPAQVERNEEKRELDTEKLPYRVHNTAFSLQSVAPASMVESMDETLKRIEDKYGNVDEFVTEELGYGSIDEMHAALAAEQVDSVAMAIAQMKEGQGFVIGDQTGVGKGRQMASLIRWANKQGKKPVFFTQKADLFTDIYRDLADVGSADLVPFIVNSDGAMLDSEGNVVYKPISSEAQNKVFKSGEIPEGYDFVVVTYSQVNTGDEKSKAEFVEAARSSGQRTSKKDKSTSRPTPKADWIRKVVKDNYLFMDESHTGAGQSNTGYYMQSISKEAKAVTYASATFAKRPDTMPLYAMRTAMSEANVPLTDLISIIQKGGVTLQEIMSRAMTKAGQMVRRERDMSDVKTDWKTIDDPDIVKRSREAYDRTITAFNAIIQFQEQFVNAKIAADDMQSASMMMTVGNKKGTKKMGIENVPFASKTYNYTKQLMLALKVDAIVDEVVKEIEAGRHPVIALESTMESSFKEFEGMELPEPTFAASLLRGLETVMQYTKKDDSGEEVSGKYLPSELGEEGERAYYELQDFIRESTSDIFISPLDAIIEGLRDKGYKVGELTGRNTIVEKNEDGKYVVKKRTDKDKKKLQREFNSGALDVLILNKSASTGISLHASNKFSDQRQRSMILAQPLSDINDYMQMIGRIDRTGQVHRGYYINLGLPVPAESRFMMMLSTKLKSLNANTTSAQDSKSNNVEAPDILNKYGSQVVIEYLREHFDIYAKLGCPLNGAKDKIKTLSDLLDYTPKEDDARKITGYVALLSTKEQEDFYNDVVQQYTDLIKYLDDTGANDLKITVMPLRAETIDKRISSNGSNPNGDNPFAQNAYVERVSMDILRKPMKVEEIRKLIENINGDNDGIAKQERLMNAIMEIAKKHIAEENARHEARVERDKKVLEEYTAKVNANDKMTDEEKANAISTRGAELELKRDEQHDTALKRTKTSDNLFYQRIRKFTVGKTYLIPDDLHGASLNMFTPAIFCGFKAKEDKLTQSSTTAVFAILNGIRKIEIKLNDGTALMNIDNCTVDNQYEASNTGFYNWDEKIPNGTRKEGYILTGNILQAVGDTQKEDGSYAGQLISYTDMEGNIHDGILMPDKWQPNMLKNSGVPINARLKQIKDGKISSIASTDGKVKLEHKWSGWDLVVPKTKKEGGKYFENPALLKLVGWQGFYQRNGEFHADITEENIAKAINELAKLGVRVADSLDDNTRFRVLDGGNAEDASTIARLESEPVEYGYRTVDAREGLQMISPMGAKLKGNGKEAVSNTTFGFNKWEQNEEHPELVDENGKIDLVKANGKILSGVDYNPYLHIRPTAVNYQFAEAWNRPTLFYIKTAYPASELNGEHKADKAKLSVGRHEWNGGDLILSRYDKPVSIVPWSELADEWMAQYGEDGVPFNRLHPRLVPVLAERGMTILPPDGNVSKACREAYDKWVADGTLNTEGSMSEERINEINDIVRKDAETGLSDMRSGVEQAAEKLNTKVNVLDNADGLTGRKARAKGWYDVKSGEITIVLSNNRNVGDALATLAHEVIGHKGMRELVGAENYDAFLDDVYNHLEGELKKRIDGETGRAFLADATKHYEEHRRERMDELFAEMAEKPFYEFTEGEKSLWMKIKEAVMRALDKMLGGKVLKNKFKIGNNEIRYMLWKSKENLENGKMGPLDMARDMSKRMELGIEDIIMRDGEDEGPDGGGNGGGNTPRRADTESAAFKKWFGDSKVVDGQGRPLVVYHGTTEGGFSSFKTPSFFTDNFDVAKSYARKTNFGRISVSDEKQNGYYECYLSIKKPFVIDAYGFSWSVLETEYNGVKIPNSYIDEEDGTATTDGWSDYIKKSNLGFDGVIIKNVYDEPYGRDIIGNVYIPFSPNQIKSIYNENPTDNPDIRLRDGGGHKVASYESRVADAERAGYSKEAYDAYQMREWNNMHLAAEEFVAKLGLQGKVTMLDTKDGLTGRKERAKGWYDPESDTITLVMLNNYSPEDVCKTILHECVAHYGLRQLFGSRFDQFLKNVYNYADWDIKRAIDNIADKQGCSKVQATEEYLGKLSEDMHAYDYAVNEGFWQTIKNMFLQFLHNIGLDKWDIRLNDGELKYILWRSYKNLTEPGRYVNRFKDAEDDMMRSENNVGEYSINEGVANMASDNVMFRDGDEARVIVRDSYERMMASGGAQFTEAMQDSMLSLKKVYEAILGKSNKIEDVADYENAYLAENRMHSMSAAQIAAWNKDCMEPVVKAVHALTGGSKDEYDRLTDYMMAKHGLERNEVMARRDADKAAEEKYGAALNDARLAAEKEPMDQELQDAVEAIATKMREYQQEQYKEFRKRDYAGLTALTEETNVKDAEGVAEMMVESYEGEHDTTDLWKAVNRATRKSLEKVFASGMMDYERYNMVRGMFEYYIPLQGFDEKVAEEAYAYMGSDGTLGYGTPIRTAKGRKSKADDPIATIQMNGEASIRQGNRNVMKQRFLNFVQAHPSDLVSIQDVWVRKNDTTGEWEQYFDAGLLATDSPSEVARKVEEFEETMKALAAQDPEHYKRSYDMPHIPFRVLEQRNMEQHQVLVRRNGRMHTIIINGNPRAAQALNGLTNPNVDTDSVFGKVVNYVQKGNRYLSLVYTTRNPEFMVSNYIRDAIYSNCMTWVKESPNYALAYHKNFGKMNPVFLGKLYAEWYSGKLRENVGDMEIEGEDGEMARLRKHFYDFMMNGGETGYTNLKDIEQHKRDLEKALKREGSTSRKAWHAFVGCLDLMNSAVENNARFAAYVTSREMGRSIGRSVYDAKEVSVNFNKKGAGDKFLGAKGQTFGGQIGAVISGLGRNLYVFWNASLQGLNNIAKAGKKHPVKFGGTVAALLTLGAVQSMISALIGGDDDDSYYDLPEYVRRSNLCFRWSKEMPWITLPLPIEFRAIYGLGELTTGVALGKERYTDEELAKEYISQLSQVMPIDFMEGGGGWHAFLPSVVKPVVEAEQNKSWSGLPIYRDNKFKENAPQWTRAYDSANKQLVEGTKWLNEKTGGSDVTQGFIDWNPAKIEYLMKGYFGGVFTMYDKMQKTAEVAVGKREMQWNEVPMASRVLKNGDERTQNRKTNNRYYDLLDEYEKTRDALNGFKKIAESDREDAFAYAERINTLENSKEYMHYQIISRYKPLLDKYYEMRKEASEEEAKAIKEEENKLRKDCVDLINAYDDGKVEDVYGMLQDMLEDIITNGDDPTMRNTAINQRKKLLQEQAK